MIIVNIIFLYTRGTACVFSFFLILYRIEVLFTDAKYPIITQKIKLISIQKLGFLTKDGDKIQGVKIYYLTSPDDNMKDNYIGGVVQNSFISGLDSFKSFDMVL